MGDQPLSNSRSETSTHVDGNDIRHSEEGCQTSSHLCGEPRALDLIGLQSSALLVALGLSVDLHDQIPQGGSTAPQWSQIQCHWDGPCMPLNPWLLIWSRS